MIIQIDVAAANNGNLIQAIPLLNDVSTKIEKQADILDTIKKSIADLIQVFFNQDHDELNVDLIRNDTPIITINKSANDLLIIIINGIDSQNIIKTLSNIGFDLNNNKNLLKL